ncbi:MAG: hypothetical protein IT359_07045 [Gemmatimonadaceae bacterium]|nr:hypothetical protein [Gemmatimonadaceae bacterium]
MRSESGVWLAAAGTPARVRRAWAVLAAALVVLAAGEVRVVAAQARAGVASLSVDGRSSDNVSIAASGRFVAVSWSAAGTGVVDIYAAASRDGGATFSAPVRVNDTPGRARVNAEMPPRVALVPRAGGGREPEVVVVWTNKEEQGWRLLVARSSDGARSFGATAIVPGSGEGGSRGWESIAVDAAGRVVVAWLDHRELEGVARSSTKRATGDGKSSAAPNAPKVSTAAPMGAHAHASPGDEMSESERMAGHSQLYATTLGGAAPRAIARSVCYCCKTSMTSSGRDVYVVWRHVFPGNQRDIAIAASRDGGEKFGEPTRVSNDRWVFDGCPDNGPAVAVDGAKRVHVAWVTPEAGGDPSKMVLYHATSSDARTFTTRVRVPAKGLPGHAQLATEAGGDVLLAWDEVGNGTRRVRLARVRVEKGGNAVIATLAGPDVGPGKSPTVATAAVGTLLAWVRTPSGAPSSIGVARVP